MRPGGLRIKQFYTISSILFWPKFRQEKWECLQINIVTNTLINDENKDSRNSHNNLSPIHICPSTCWEIRIYPKPSIFAVREHTSYCPQEKSTISVQYIYHLMENYSAPQCCKKPCIIKPTSSHLISKTGYFFKLSVVTVTV